MGFQLHVTVRRGRSRKISALGISCKLLRDQLNELLPLLEAVVQSGKPLVIIAEDVEGEALATSAGKRRFLPTNCHAQEDGKAKEIRRLLQERMGASRLRGSLLAPNKHARGYLHVRCAGIVLKCLQRRKKILLQYHLKFR
jgi:hypothetical protein